MSAPRPDERSRLPGSPALPGSSKLSTLPIGVFDSGVGGLTVLRALREALPGESFLYLGDTARLPYGTKSPESVARYSVQATEALVEAGIKLLVVACNTAASVALPAIADEFPDLPVIGVLEPGAAAACAASRSGRIAVIATEGTVRGGAYERAIRRLRPEAKVISAPCQLFVALAEEGWTDGDIAAAVARRYLAPLFTRATGVPGTQVPDTLAPDTLVLGCTHFPVLHEVIAGVVGPDVTIVDSARTTASAVAAEIAKRALASTSAGGSVRFLATDGPERFARVGERFLGVPVSAEDVELVDL